MAFSQLYAADTVPGDISFVPLEISADRNFLIINRDLDENDVRQWGTLLLQIYVPFPVDEYSTVYAHNCFTRAEVRFNPIAMLGTLNIRVGFYAPVRTLPQSIEIWTEQ